MSQYSFVYNDDNGKKMETVDFLSLVQVSKAYSKTWSYREDALLAVYKQMQDLPASNKEDAKNTMRAAIFLVKRGIDDNVYAVSNQTYFIITFLKKLHFIPLKRITNLIVCYNLCEKFHVDLKNLPFIALNFCIKYNNFH